MPSPRPDVRLILDTAKSLMRETPSIDVGIALYRAGTSASYPRTAEYLDNLLSIEERASTTLSIIDKLYARPEVTK